MVEYLLFYEEIIVKQGLSYISFCPLRILYNSKFILMTSLGTKAAVVMKVHSTFLYSFAEVIYMYVCV